jgi:transposase-like protein
MSCPRCNSEVLTKGGTTQLGGQRFRCKHCGRRFTRRSSSAFSRRAFSDDIIALAVRWYVRYRLSYPEVSEWLAERGILVDQSTVYRWVQRFLPLFGGAVRKYRQPVGSDWRVDETYALLASAAVGTTSIAPLMAVGRLSTPMSLHNSRHGGGAFILRVRHRFDWDHTASRHHRQGSYLSTSACRGRARREA